MRWVWPAIGSVQHLASVRRLGEQPPTDAVEWGYGGSGGPEDWASLSEEYATCADGQQQSPVDITGYEMTDAEPISFLYDSDAGSSAQ